MILPKEEFKKRVMLVGNKNYHQLFSYFVNLLRKTRLPYLKHNAFFMSALQISMVKTLSKWQKELRQIKTELSQATSEKEGDILKQKLLFYTEWIRIFQTIADGIAWRNLRFNRPLIRLFSENDSPGHINEDYVQIFQRYLSRMPNFIIVNDLTRCLRISDLTQILPNGKVFLYEIKRSGNVLKDIGYVLKEMRKHKRIFSSQELRQWVVQSAIIEKKIKVPVYKNGRAQEQLKAEIINLNFHIKTHFSAIKKLIKKADKHGYANTELEDGYFVEISAYDKIIENFNSASFLQYQKEQFEKYAPKWCKDKKDKVITLSNYESFLQEGGHYTRNWIPYSVIPFSARDCVRLMMGYLHFNIYYNLNVLEEKLEKAGWVIEKRNWPYSKKQGKLYRKEPEERGSFYKHNVDEDLYRLSRKDKNGICQTAVLITQVLIMLASMYQTKFLIDEINLLYSKAKRGRSRMRTVTINFLGEQKVLV